MGGAARMIRAATLARAQRRVRLRLRCEVILHYGACACCGERTLAFLSIDHTAGDGAAHRRAIGASGVNVYFWLRTNGYPDGFRVLCHNCNMATHHQGRCPHQTGDVRDAAMVLETVARRSDPPAGAYKPGHPGIRKREDY